MNKNIREFNKKWIIGLILVTLVVVFSFYKYFNDYYSYTDEYYQTIEKCEVEKLDDEICKGIKNIDTPKERFEKEDAMTLYYEVNYLYFSDIMIVLFPLIIIILVILETHSEIKSGFIRNYLLRDSLSNYKKRMNIIVLKVATLIPISILLIFFLSCLITGFDFNVDDSIKVTALYDSWSYDHFFLYLGSHSLILYIMGIFYGNIGLLYLNKNKNTFLVILFSYVTFFVIVIFVYVFYAIVLNNLGFSNLMNYFNIFDFWKIYPDETSNVGILAMACIIATLTFAVKEIIFKNKEKVIVENEKELN